MTKGPSTYDLSYDHSSSHHHSSSNLFEQKAQTIQQASDVLRTLINKLPEKDFHEGQHSNHEAVQIIPSHEIGHHQVEYFVPQFKPMKTEVPFNLNNLPTQQTKHPQILTSHLDALASTVPAPPGADPNAYKIYRAMAHKLSGSKHARPQPSHITSKKPYLILDNFDESQIFDAHNANSHNQQFNQGPKDHPTQFVPDTFDLQKTINFEYAGPIHPQHLKRHVPTEISKASVQKRQIKIRNVNHNKRPAS